MCELHFLLSVVNPAAESQGSSGLETAYIVHTIQLLGCKFVY